MILDYQQLQREATFELHSGALSLRGCSVPTLNPNPLVATQVLPLCRVFLRSERDDYREGPRANASFHSTIAHGVANDSLGHDRSRNRCTLGRGRIPLTRRP